MNRWKDQRGAHTWEVSTDYHRCPLCNKIFENREKYTYELGNYIKELECPFCQKTFKIKKTGKISIGPFFGEPTPVEMEWGNND